MNAQKYTYECHPHPTPETINTPAIPVVPTVHPGSICYSGCPSSVISVYAPLGIYSSTKRLARLNFFSAYFAKTEGWCSRWRVRQSNNTRMVGYICRHVYPE